MVLAPDAETLVRVLAEDRPAAPWQRDAAGSVPVRRGLFACASPAAMVAPYLKIEGAPEWVRSWGAIPFVAAARDVEAGRTEIFIPVSVKDSALLARPAGQGGAEAFVPARFGGVVGGDLRWLWTAGRTLRPSLADALAARVRALVGLDFEREVLPLVEGSFAVAVDGADDMATFPGISPTWLVVVRVRDAEGARRLLERGAGPPSSKGAASLWRLPQGAVCEVVAKPFPTVLVGFGPRAEAVVREGSSGSLEASVGEGRDVALHAAWHLAPLLLRARETPWGRILTDLDKGEYELAMNRARTARMSDDAFVSLLSHAWILLIPKLVGTDGATTLRVVPHGVRLSTSGMVADPGIVFALLAFHDEFVHQEPVARTAGLRAACGSNLKLLATALEMYSADHGGAYPPALGALVPDYLHLVPTCPAAGRDTYSSGYTVNAAEGGFTIMCTGHHHPDLPPDHPRYTPTEGVVEQGP
jgi:hypothetical protein